MKKIIPLLFVTILGAAAFSSIFPTFTNNNVQEAKADSVPSGAIYVNDWGSLKNRVKNASKGDYICLSNDILTSDLSDRVKADGKNITIDLRGHSIRKSDASSYHKDGHIFEIQGNSNFTLTDTVGGGIIENGCANNGGAINIHDGSTCRVSNVTFYKNRAGTDGGAIYNRGYLVMNNCVIDNNTAVKSGGGIYNTGDGWLELTNVEISHNVAQNDGGGLKIYMDGNCTMRNCNIHHNRSVTEDGGGFVVADDSHKLRLYNTTVNYNFADDDGGGMCIEEGDVEVYGCDFSYNEADFGGGIYNDDYLVIKNDSHGVTTITFNNTNNDGGGIYSKDDLIIDNISVMCNTCAWLGGGICVSDGDCILNNGTISYNQCQYSNGGGIAVRNEGVLYFRGGEVTNNTAEMYGGGIFLHPDYSEKDKLYISGVVVCKDNYCNRGPNLWFASCEEIHLEGKILEGTYIDFTMVEGHTCTFPCYTTWYDLDDFDEITQEYYKYNGTEDPSKFFYNREGYVVYYDSDEKEAAVKNEKVPVPFPEKLKDDTFIPWNEQIETDVNLLNGQNWLSGVSGERKLNEINTPVTHDSSMKEIAAATSCMGSFLDYYDYAVTQYGYIYEQLGYGIRGLDLRLSNKRVWKRGRERGDQTDDGENLFMCHGKSSAGGTFYAADPDTGYPLNFQKVLDWVEDFLTRHPTEYVMMDFSAECQHDYDIPIVFKRLDKILRERVNDINPTTGEPFFYLQDGVYGKAYSDWPKLKDVRGKMVIKCKQDLEVGVNVGGLKDVSFGGKYYNPEQKGSYKLSDIERLKDIEEFESREIAKRDLKSDASRLVDSNTGKEVYFVTCTNCIKEEKFGIPGDTPIYLSKYVNYHCFGRDKIFGAARKGKYLGWVSSDAVTAATCYNVYCTNFFDDLEYKTITVDSGKEELPTQTFKVLKGTEITIPGYIYKNDYVEGGDNDNFTGWSIGTTRYTPGSKYIVNDDVTFSANWLKEASCTDIRFIWFDADDKDGLRPTSVDIKTTNGLGSHTLDAEHGWVISIPGQITSKDQLIIDWNLCDVDGEGTYGAVKINMAFPSRSLYFVYFTHTPDDQITISSTVSFTDNCVTNEDGPRPDYVTYGLYRRDTSGDTLIEQKEFAVGEGAYSSSTTLSFSPVPKYRMGGEVNYVVKFISSRHDTDKGDLSLYDCSINGYDVSYTLKDIVNAELKVYWLDVDIEDRPSSLTIGLKDTTTGRVVNDTLNPQNSDESSSLYSYLLIADGTDSETGENYVDYSHYQVLINDSTEGIYYYTFSNEEGLYVVASRESYASDVALVESLIDDIGEVTKEKEGKITLARSFYEILSSSSKTNVSNYQTLTDAEDTLAELKQAGIDSVELLIENIGTVEYTSECLEKIESAREAYDALSGEEQILVGNYSLLERAEEQYASLQKKAMKEQEEINRVIDAISSIGEVVYGEDEDSFSDIHEARSDYNLLSAEQKAQVTNYNVLINAEAEYFALYFLNETSEICSTGLTSDDHGEALEEVWSAFSSAWDTLNDDAKEIFVIGTASENIIDFKARYTHIMSRYSGTLTPFEEGPAYVVVPNQIILANTFVSVFSSSSATVIIVAIATMSFLSVTLFFIKRRKQQ